MSKKMLLAAAVLALASCAAEKEAPFFRYCPNVQLVPEFSRMTQMAGKQEEAKIELIGYEGYCRTDLRNQTKAVVAPIFEVSRRTEVSNEYVRFSYYTDTGDNKVALIGRENHPVSVKVPNVGEKVMYQGDYVEMRIPDNEPGFVIKMGLVLSNAQYRYNRTHGLK